MLLWPSHYAVRFQTKFLVSTDGAASSCMSNCSSRSRSRNSPAETEKNHENKEDCKLRLQLAVCHDDDDDDDDDDVFHVSVDDTDCGAFWECVANTRHTSRTAATWRPSQPQRGCKPFDEINYSSQLTVRFCERSEPESLTVKIRTISKIELKIQWQQWRPDSRRLHCLLRKRKSKENIKPLPTDLMGVKFDLLS
jgi:hypothetical protein